MYRTSTIVTMPSRCQNASSVKYISRVYIRVCTERPRSSQPTAQSFPEIKSQVLNSFRRTPFACTKRLISTHSYSGSCTHIESHEMRVQNVHQSLSGCQNVCNKRLSTSHMLSGYQNARLLSSNSFLGGQFVCAERLTSTHSFSRCQNEWLPPRHIENACTKHLSSSPSLS